jgi:folate-binding protein YgfZ
VSSYRSPSLDRPGACPAPEGTADEGVPWHYGDPHGEQRLLAEGAGAVDLSHRGVVRVGGTDRLSWLHTVTTQHLEALEPGGSTTALVLSPHGHVEHELHVVDDGEATWLVTERWAVDALVGYLDSMRFLLRVEVADVSDAHAVVGGPAAATAVTGSPVWRSPVQYATSDVVDDDCARYVPRRPAAWPVQETIVAREVLPAVLDGAGPLAGSWAWEALRVAAGVPRLGFETDHRTIPHEVGWVPAAVHLHKGCYRGQETVARVHNLGRPPRRLVLLLLDGSDPRAAVPGDPVEVGGRQVGRLTSVAQHYELGPIALAVVKRSVPDDAAVTVGGAAVGLQPVVVG